MEGRKFYLVISHDDPPKLIPHIDDERLGECGLVAVCTPFVDHKGPRNNIHWCRDRTEYESFVGVWRKYMVPEGLKVLDLFEPFCQGFLFTLSEGDPFVVDKIVDKIAHIFEADTYSYHRESFFEYGTEAVSLNLVLKLKFGKNKKQKNYE